MYLLFVFFILGINFPGTALFSPKCYLHIWIYSAHLPLLTHPCFTKGCWKQMREAIILMVNQWHTFSHLQQVRYTKDLFYIPPIEASSQASRQEVETERLLLSLHMLFGISVTGKQDLAKRCQIGKIKEKDYYSLYVNIISDF